MSAVTALSHYAVMQNTSSLALRWPWPSLLLCNACAPLWAKPFLGYGTSASGQWSSKTPKSTLHLKYSHHFIDKASMVLVLLMAMKSHNAADSMALNSPRV